MQKRIKCLKMVSGNRVCIRNLCFFNYIMNNDQNKTNPKIFTVMVLVTRVD